MYRLDIAQRHRQTDGWTDGQTDRLTENTIMPIEPIILRAVRSTKSRIRRKRRRFERDQGL